jgi:hypothetical protein
MFFHHIFLLTTQDKGLYFAGLALDSQPIPPIEGTQVSKVRKPSHDEVEPSEMFSDEDFSADEFVEKMDGKVHHHRAETRSSWRRLEELREAQMLRDQLGELEDWKELEKS